MPRCMNSKRLILAIVAVFVGVFVTDYLIHEVWLKSTYEQTMNLWRPKADMQARFVWLMLGQFLAAATFATLWAKGFAGSGRIRRACLYGLCMGLFSQATTFITFAVQPFPRDLAVKWVVAGLAQGVLMGLLVSFVYNPKPGDARPQTATQP